MHLTRDVAWYGVWTDERSAVRGVRSPAQHARHHPHQLQLSSSAGRSGALSPHTAMPVFLMRDMHDSALLAPPNWDGVQHRFYRLYGRCLAYAVSIQAVPRRDARQRRHLGIQYGIPPAVQHVIQKVIQHVGHMVPDYSEQGVIYVAIPWLPNVAWRHCLAYVGATVGNAMYRGRTHFYHARQLAPSGLPQHTDAEGQRLHDFMHQHGVEYFFFMPLQQVPVGAAGPWTTGCHERNLAFHNVARHIETVWVRILQTLHTRRRMGLNMRLPAAVTLHPHHQLPAVRRERAITLALIGQVVWDPVLFVALHSRFSNWYHQQRHLPLQPPQPAANAPGPQAQQQQLQPHPQQLQPPQHGYRDYDRRLCALVALLRLHHPQAAAAQMQRVEHYPHNQGYRTRTLMRMLAVGYSHLPDYHPLGGRPMDQLELSTVTRVLLARYSTG